jgi:anti-sigma B factor antagonist
MEIISKTDDNVLKIGILGELDASGAINLDNVLSKAIGSGHFNILVDCERLDYISSAGLGVFISHIAEIQENNGELVFYNMSDKVKSIFTILGLEKVIAITGDFSEARKMIKN